MMLHLTPIQYSIFGTFRVLFQFQINSPFGFRFHLTACLILFLTVLMSCEIGMRFGLLKANNNTKRSSQWNSSKDFNVLI